MHVPSVLPLATVLAVLVLPRTGAINIQSPAVKGNADRANAIRDSFQKSFGAYKKFCYGHDELRPLSTRCDDPLGGWGATLVDAMSTAKVMGLQELFDESVKKVAQTDYTKTDSEEVSLFETVIRHLGGLLSAYDLNGRKDKILVDQATTLSNKLLKGWVGDNPAPFNTLREWNSGPKPKTQDNDAIIAETGTNIIEFDRMSKFSGNKTYLEYAEKSMKATINASPLPFPGLNTMGINPRNGKTTDPDLVTFGGGSDSFFEYEIKYAHLIGSADTWAPAWVQTIKSAIQQLIVAPPGGTVRNDLVYLADYSKKANGIIPRFSHLGCFAGGNWLLGAKLLKNDKVFNYGLGLTEACINTYTSSATGLGPGYFAFKTTDGSTNRVNITDEKFYKEHGFNYYKDFKVYGFGPEVLESVFYAYRLTGDPKWQELSWRAFQSLIKYTSTEKGGLASIDDVSNPNTKQRDEGVGSYLYAELYKYLYLTQVDGDTIDLGKYVFNTEGHPFRIDDDSFVLSDHIDAGKAFNDAQPSKAQKEQQSSGTTSESSATAQLLPPQISSFGAALQRVLGGGY
ncbi:unnamed protein product [Sympodiomycopsis kandeliae]